MDAGGTGFVIAPGVVVTCAHVVAGAHEVRGRIGEGDEFALTVSDEDRYRAANGLDIAFLRFDAESCSALCILPSPKTNFGDRMWAYGHPKGDYRAGQWAALEYQGDSRLTFGDSMPMHRGYGTPVGEGFSGSPVVNERTGAVCGMLARSNKAGSAHMVPVTEILARCTVPEPSIDWLDTLTDEQLRAGGFRYPGTLLRDYLEAAREAADEHPYAALLADVGHIPLSTVYVRQEASPTADTPTHQSRPDELTAATSVLDGHRHVLFTGGAGSGKSSVLRRLTFTAASEWLKDPAQAPPYLPVRVAAEQLLGLPFTETLSAAVGRDLPGLRRSLSPELFEAPPMPEVDWLVCVDGLDEVLDPEDRGRVIQLIQRWAREPYLRFAVASRSLVMAEMDRLDALLRYSLLPFDETAMRGVAEAWFTVLKAPNAVRRADELVVSLRQGRLGEVARNPLYLTMICVVTAITDLPRNPAELYRQFLRILRDKGAQRLRRGDPRVDGITPEFLEAVHEVLGQVAELRQSGDARALVDQALERLTETFPEVTASKDLVFRTLTFTGLVTQRGGELTFPHHTIQEYLAAGAIADRRNPKDPEALEIVREAIASERPNLVLFLAARWHEKGMSLDEFLRTVVEVGGWRDLLLCATILSDGLVIDEGLTARFTRAVIKLDGRSVAVGDLKADSVLDRLYAILGPRELTSIVRDPEVPHGPRLSALKHCVRRTGEGAAELAANFAEDTDLPVSARIAAARMLADAGERQAACRILTEITRDPDQLPEMRFDAAESLHRVDREAGTELLAEFLSTIDAFEHQIELSLGLLNSSRDHAARAALAEALTTNQALTHAYPDRCRYLRNSLLYADRPELLEDFCRDTTMPVYIRYMAALALTRKSSEAETIWQTLWSDILSTPESSEEAVDIAVSECRDRALVESAARNGRLALSTRIAAAGRLLQLGEHSVAADCARDLPEEPDWQESAIHLADVFRELGEGSRARQLLLDVLSDPHRAATARLRCVAPLLDLGELPRVRDVLSKLSRDNGIAAADRFTAVDALNQVDPATSVRRLTDMAADAALPGDVRLDAAVRLLSAGHRSAAAELLRRISQDPFSGTARRIKALTTLAEVDIHAASETLHRLMDEPGLTARYLWGVLDLADALVPDAILRERLDALLGDTTIPSDDFLHIESVHLRHRTAMVPLIQRTLDRIVNDPAAEPRTRARAVVRSFGLIRYTRWKALMTSLAPEPLHRLSLHTIADGFGSSGVSSETWQYLSLERDSDTVGSLLGALAGVDPLTAIERWLELLSLRRPVAVRELGPLSYVIHGGRLRDRVDDLLLAWAKDPEAPLADRIAAADLADETRRYPWYYLALDDCTPAELRTTICDHLPGSGAYNRVPLLRTLAATPTVDIRTRASAAALLGEDLGEEGRCILHEISGPHTTNPEAHLAAAAAWEKLDIGREAVAAYGRVLDDEQTDPTHRVTAAGELIKWPALRGRAKEALAALLNSPEALVVTRISAAEKLLAAHEQAEAHLGLFRLARTSEPTPAERERIAALLPPDLAP
ncbi:serine protease [Streptomyces mirabilis]|uniref:serine protease n=1 Tax=Streptomyces mirabilis TaxID=68239 RepID=UPI002259A544|nr:serine protease [Streptomyces mirabilis]MCX4608722.1 trypsin-like peptidase domain-containing protein [Streptomyces mirabilis]